MEVEIRSRLEGQVTTKNPAVEKLKWKLWNNIKTELF